MRKFAKVAMAGALMTATLGGIAAPAEAHVGAGGAIIAGLAGLGIGAAIASDHPHHYYGGGYGTGYGGYAAAPADYGYAPPPPPSYGYEEVRQCRVSQRWDDWQGRYVPIRRCW